MSFLPICTVVPHFSLTHKKMSRQTVRVFAEVKMYFLALLKNLSQVPAFCSANLMVNLKPYS